jgi:hypothetical protein
MTATLRVQGCSPVPATANAAQPSVDASASTGSQSGEHPRSSDSRFIGTTADFRRGYQLADRIYALHQPWRARFVVLIAERVGATVWSERLPSRTQLAVWLSSEQLARLVDRMLRIWTDENC